MVTGSEKRHVILTWLDFAKFLIYAFLIGNVSGVILLAIGVWTNWYHLLGTGMFNLFILNYWFITIPSLVLMILILYVTRKKKPQQRLTIQQK